MQQDPSLSVKEIGVRTLLFSNGYIHGYKMTNLQMVFENFLECFYMATEYQHPPAHHPMDVRYHSVVDEPQLS